MTLMTLFDSSTFPSDLQPGEPVLVSSCLLGEVTTWDGKHDFVSELVELLERAEVEIIPICPEVLGGLPIPRPPAEPPAGNGFDVLDGKSPVLVVGDSSETGSDATEAFLSGAHQVVEMAQVRGVRYAWMNERSPSCGVLKSHSGGGLADGPGVASAALERAGVTVFPGQV